MFGFRSNQNTPTKKTANQTENDNSPVRESSNDMSEVKQEKRIKKQQNGKPPQYEDDSDSSSMHSDQEQSESESENEGPEGSDGPLDGVLNQTEGLTNTVGDVTDQATNVVDGVTKTTDQATNAIKDVALNPLGGKKKKSLSQTIGEENLKNVGKKNGKEDKDNGSLKIRIQLDLDVEVHLSARIKGDITIGLL